MSSEFRKCRRELADGSEKVYTYPSDRYVQPERKDTRKNNGKRKGWQVAEMWDNHHEIARRLVLGESNKSIATALNVTPEQVSNVRNSPVVQDKISIMRAARDANTIDLAKEIQDLAPIALERVREALENGKTLGKELSGSAVLKEANALLDREIGKPTQTINNRNLNAQLTLDDIEAIKRRAKELAPENFDFSLQDPEEL